MKIKVYIKWLVGIFALTLMLSLGVACKGQKGEIKQPPENIHIQFYSASYSNEMDDAEPYTIIEHRGIEPRMYVYTLKNSYGEPFYVKPGHLEDAFGNKIDEKFYKLVSGVEKWTCVQTTKTLIWDYEMYRYNEENELYPAYAVRIQWQIFIDEVDDPPYPMHGEWISQTRVPPTCTEKGYIRYLCACGCGEEKLEYEDARGHNWTSWVSKSDGRTHERFCVNDLTHHEVELCHGGVANCKEKAVCEICGWSYGVLGGHTYQNGVCSLCGEEEYSIGVSFTLSEDGTYYVAGRRSFSFAEEEAFADELADVKIPGRYNGKPVKEIGKNAFWQDKKIKTLCIGDGVERINEWAFNGCTNLMEISLPNSLNLICYGVFGGSGYVNTESNWTENGVLYLDEWLLLVDMLRAGDSELDVFTVKDGTRGVASGAFMANGFAEIVFPDSVEYFDGSYYCFNNIVEKITFGAGVKTITGMMFSTTSGEIIISENNPYYKVVDEFILTKDGKELIYCFGTSSELTVPDGVEIIVDRAFLGSNSCEKVILNEGLLEIGESAFAMCTELREIVLPDSLQRLGVESFDGCISLISIHIGVNLSASYIPTAYFGINLRTITLSEENPYMKLVEGVLYTADGKALLLYPAKDARESYTVLEGTEILEEWSLAGARYLKELILPSSLKEIKMASIASCISLRELVIPDSVHTIEKFAIEDNTRLLALTLGTGLKNFDDDAIRFCDKLTEIYNRSSLQMQTYTMTCSSGIYKEVTVYSDPTASKLETDENGFVLYKDGDNLILVDYVGEATNTLTIPSGVTEIGQGSMTNLTFYLDTVILPDSVVKIGARAFQRQIFLEKVVCGTGLKEIDNEAFALCEKLSTIEINSKLERIGTNAFSRTAILPWNETETVYIGEYFLYAPYLDESIIIEEGTILLADHSIWRARGDEAEWLVLPKSIQSLGSPKTTDAYASPKIIYYCGSESEWGKVEYVELLKGSTVYFYSETQVENGWRYVDGIPTAWSI